MSRFSPVHQTAPISRVLESQPRSGAAEFFITPAGTAGVRAVGNQIKPALTGFGIAVLGYGIAAKSSKAVAVGFGLLLWATLADDTPEAA